MSLQNRVTPFGDIISTNARGTLMGNRGCLHNSNKEIIRNYDLISWITCTLDYKGKKREVMARGKYTELFFLDEATSFSAGHRPCSLCRYNDFINFKEIWLDINSTIYNMKDKKMQTIDLIIHEERIDHSDNKKFYIDELFNLPDGTFVCLLNNVNVCYLFYNNLLFQWQDNGYSSVIIKPPNEKVLVLTPKSIVNTFRQGYRPRIHESAIRLMNL